MEYNERSTDELDATPLTVRGRMDPCLFDGLLVILLTITVRIASLYQTVSCFSKGNHGSMGRWQV